MMTTLIDDFRTTMSAHRKFMIALAVMIILASVIVPHYENPEVLRLAGIYLKASALDRMPDHDATMTFINEDGERVTRMAIFITTGDTIYRRAFDIVVGNVVFGIVLAVFINAGVFYFLLIMKMLSRSRLKKDRRIMNTEIVDAAQLKKFMARNSWRVSDE